MSQLESEKSKLGGGGTPIHRKGSDNCESSGREIISENKRGEGGFNPQQTEKTKVKSERGRGGVYPHPNKNTETVTRQKLAGSFKKKYKKSEKKTEQQREALLNWLGGEKKESQFEREEKEKESLLKK